MSFVHLHVHSCYSLLDGAIRLDDLVKTAKEMGMPAVAVTDHGQMFGLWQFYKAAVKVGVKPILGVEAYVTKHGRQSRNQNETRYHLTLLSQNLEGYQNLCRMISLANIEGFYYKPRVDHELLEKYSKGVIALSGCLQGEVPNAILSGRLEDAKQSALKLADIFPNRFYLELQENGLPHQAIANKALVDLSKETGIPLVATNDCHYLKKEDHEGHDVLLCIQTNKLVSDHKRMRMETNEFYFKSPQEMAHDFSWCPEALANTLAIAEQCNLEFPSQKVYLFPTLPGLSEDNAAEQMNTKAVEGLEKRFKAMEDSGQPFSQEQKEKYRRQLDEELKVINQMKFPVYFLIVADFISWAKERKIPVGPGRGSAVGSVVSWSLGITDVDPIRYDLLFERFLNTERMSMPDIDVDFCAECRDDVIRYVTKTYGGSEYVAQILTLGQMKAKAAIKSVGRVLGLPLAQVSAIASQVPEKLTLSQTIKNSPSLQTLMRDSPKINKLIELALFLENMPHHSSTHASGVVIGHVPLMEVLPVFCDTKIAEEDGRRTNVITQYNYKEVEQNGLVKFDFLGLKTLTLIKHCLALLANKGITVDLLTIDFNDPKAYELLRSGKVSGVFQIDNPGIKETLVRLQPTKIEDLVALVALYRPGPIQGGMVDLFIKYKHGLQEPVYDLEILKPILEETLGVIIYQEQVMRISQVMAGYSLGKADELRNAMGKKLPEEMKKHRSIFIEGSVQNNIPLDQATAVFDKIEKFAEYGFNKAHSVAYAYLILWTSYLKAHHPIEYMAALMSSEADNQAKISSLIDECHQDGIEVMPPDLNSSFYKTSVDKGRIVFGLGAIKGVGQGAIDTIIEARKKRPFIDLYDFCERIDGKKVTRRVVESLIKCGAMDSFGGSHRTALLACLPLALEQNTKKHKTKPPKVSLLSGLAPPKPVEIKPQARMWPEVQAMTVEERLGFEKELLGFYVTGHPLDPYKPAMEILRSHSMAEAKLVTTKTKVVLCGQLKNYSCRVSKKGNTYATALLSSFDDSIEVMFFHSVIQKYKDLLEEGKVLVIIGSIDGVNPDEKRRPKILADKVAELDGNISKLFPSIVLDTSVDHLTPIINFFSGRTLKQKSSKERGLSSVYFKISDGSGQGLYRLDDTVELSVDFFQDVGRHLGPKALKCSEKWEPIDD
ncbi:MAG: DNA polymerase III subunit alpha [Deltaproteobacteria bacterium]|jgi:DNA polymerase-3 subunit alpha|nr:DNA polymerase III subunit alpha [Deltaproteobacteria bacterium]